MSGATLSAIADYLDGLLRIAELPDYPNALNGIQVQTDATITRVAAAVDISRTVIEQAIATNANLLVVHHGMFWRGIQPVRGVIYDRLKLLLDHRIGVYSAHLPLDAHPDVGNNVLLARELGLVPTGAFAHHQGMAIGVRGEAAVATADLIERTRIFARHFGGDARTTPVRAGQVTRQWGICTGAGASAETIAEATMTGLDTLIVGEGPHWTAVEARDLGLTIIYAGHYATETLGVRAVAERVARKFNLEPFFIDAPTGL